MTNSIVVLKVQISVANLQNIRFYYGILPYLVVKQLVLDLSAEIHSE